MKAIGKCEVCGGKIIKAGNGNIFCENCADKNFGQRLQEWADRKELQKIKRRALAKCGITVSGMKSKPIPLPTEQCDTVSKALFYTTCYKSGAGNLHRN